MIASLGDPKSDPDPKHPLPPDYWPIFSVVGNLVASFQDAGIDNVDLCAVLAASHDIQNATGPVLQLRYRNSTNLVSDVH